MQRLLNVHNLIVDQSKIAKAKQKDYAHQLSTPKQFNDAIFVFLIKMSLHLFEGPSTSFHGTIMSCYHYPRTPYNLIDPPIDLIPQQNNKEVLQRLLTIHNHIVDQKKN